MVLRRNRRWLVAVIVLVVVCAVGIFGVQRWGRARNLDGNEMLDKQAQDAPAPNGALANLAQDDVFREGIPTAVPLPWENATEFKDAVAKNDTNVRMAAFRAILQDPVGSEVENIALAARALAGTVVPPSGVFSQNQTLGPYDEQHGYLPGPNYSGGRIVIGAGGGVCKISTLLYNLTVLSDLPVVNRRPHSLIVPYVPAGQDATVTYSGGIDYQFKNDTTGPLLIWGEMIDNTLLMAFYGTTTPPIVEWQHDVISRTEPTTEVRHNPDLQPGETRVIFEGFEAITVRSRALITEKDGTKRIRDLGVSSYNMAPRIEEHDSC